jgi:hypothetical protein
MNFINVQNQRINSFHDLVFQLMQVTRLLMAVERGCLNNWKGQNLSDIDYEGTELSIIQNDTLKLLSTVAVKMKILVQKCLYNFINILHNLLRWLIYRTDLKACFIIHAFFKLIRNSPCGSK